MAEQQGERIRVVLRKLQINDNLEPFYDDEGEFRFHIRVSSRNGVSKETTLPEQGGHYTITDHPSWNQLVLNHVVFDGEVEDHLEIEITGEEIDLVENDQLTPYRRVFEGEPSSWIGHYRPGDEGSSDPERMKDWWVFLDIEKA
jgi:hypothetical protein